MKKYKIRTFRGYSYKGSLDAAEQEAKDMIMDIIVDAQPKAHWWAEVVRCDDNEQVLFIRCPELWKWDYLRKIKTV